MLSSVTGNGSGKESTEIDEALESLGRQGLAWPLYVVAEKILGEHEPLPRDWAVDGTTGYDFLNAVNGLFVPPQNAARMEQVYIEFISATVDSGPKDM